MRPPLSPEVKAQREAERRAKDVISRERAARLAMERAARKQTDFQCYANPEACIIELTPNNCHMATDDLLQLCLGDWESQGVSPLEIIIRVRDREVARLTNPNVLTGRRPKVVQRLLDETAPPARRRRSAP